MPLSARSKVLLVDDQPARLLSYEAILGGLDVELVKADSGEAALHALIKGEFAVILLDVNMPGMDGFETASLIHQHPRHEKTPIIFVTGVHVTDMDRLRGYTLGAFDYVYVPVIPEILRTKVTVLCELFQQRQELRRLNESLRAEKTRELEALNANLERTNSELAQTNENLRAESLERGRAEARMRFLADTIPSIVWTCSPDGSINYVNRHWLDYYGESGEGQTPQTLPGLVIHADEAESTRTHVIRSLASGERFEFEARHRRHDGEYNWFMTRTVPWYDSDGRLTSWFGVTTDIHPQRELMERLRESDRRKDEFLAILGHELRNPLAPIYNAVQIMGSYAGDSRLASLRDIIDRQVQQLMRLVDDLLDVSRITRGKVALRREPVDLAALIAGAVETSQPMIERRQQVLSLHLSQEPLHVHGDVVRLSQVLSNLLNNASKFSADGSRIELHLQREEQQALLRVRDQGGGIPVAMLERIFEPFTQVDAMSDRMHGGLGIGLALVRSLVELHGGKVEADSAGPGCGAEFLVRLPLADTASARSAPVIAEAPPRGESRRILVADDNDDAAASLAALLRLDGHEVRQAADGAEAVEAVEHFRPDVVLLDLGMPRMDGYQAARCIRRLPGGMDALLVAVSGWGQKEDRERTRIAGFDAHCVKPIQYEELLRLLATPRVAVG